MESKYYPHHVHLAQGSIGDSILKIPEYIARAKEYGLKHLTMTDHGSLSAMYAFCDECKKQGIEPIVGMEAYECEDKTLKDVEHKGYTHLVLLAKNREGMKNLFSIHNHAAVDGFYYKPRTDLNDLKAYGRSIIGMSACVAGSIPQAILKDEPEKAIQLIEAYKQCFDEFYLELQPGTFEEQIKVNNALVELSEYTNTPLVVTNDIHYLNADDYSVHDSHVKLGRKMKDLSGDLCYPDTCYWFMSYEDIKKAFTYTDVVTEEVIEEALKNAYCIAEKCSAEFSSEMHMPCYTEENEEETLYKLCFEKLNALIQDKPNPQDYIDRMLYELEVIKEKGFCGYFLVVQDYVKYASKAGIPVGPGRGSAAGSLVAYILGISKADPLTYGLMFERFLDPHREAIPDIDVDFSPGEEGREAMFRYMVKRYGYDHCALVSTLHMRKAKGAIRDAARVLGYEPAIGDEIAKLIPVVVYGDDGEKTTDLDIISAIEAEPELKKIAEQYKDIVDLAVKLEGLPSSSSLHAAGILVSPVCLTDKLPLIRPNKEGVLATSLNLEDSEKNFVKFDFLGVASLDVIKNTEKDIGWDFDYNDEELLHDDEVWSLIGSRNTTGIFQIASKTYKDRMPRLRPGSLDELAACLALVRGPCISAKMDETYMSIIEGKEERKLVHPIYDNITKDTNGVLLYQEQIMRLAVAFGFDLTTGYRIVKAGAKKKFDVLKQYREEFLNYAADKNVDEDTTNFIFDLIVNSAQYSFNKSHAISYALITYVSAYLKVHYPLEFMKNLLTNTYARGEKESYDAVLEDCRRMGIKFLQPDINKSEWGFTIEDNMIRIGMCAIKGFGDKAATQALQARPFNSLEDLLERVEKKQFNKKVVNVAIFSGLLDSIEGEIRRDTYEKYMDMRDEEAINEINVSKGFVIDTFGDIGDLEDTIMGGNFTADPANDFSSFGWKDMSLHRSFKAECYIKKVKKIKTKKGDAMAFATVATGDGIIECTIFPTVYKKVKSLLKKKQFCILNAKKESADTCIVYELSAA